MAEQYPSDSELLALTQDGETGCEYIATGQAPYYLEFRQLVSRLLLAAKRANDLRAYDAGGLNIGVRAGAFLDGSTLRSTGGVDPQGLTDDTTNTVYLTADGTLTISTSGYPAQTATPHLRLATVVCASGDITSITDDRGGHLWCLPSLPLSGGSLTGGLTLDGATDELGSATVADAAALTSTEVTTADADATYGTEERDLINEIKADYNLLRADVSALRTTVNTLLTELRKTAGCGVLSG